MKLFDFHPRRLYSKYGFDRLYIRITAMTLLQIGIVAAAFFVMSLWLLMLKLQVRRVYMRMRAVEKGFFAMRDDLHESLGEEDKPNIINYSTGMLPPKRVGVK